MSKIQMNWLACLMHDLYFNWKQSKAEASCWLTSKTSPLLPPSFRGRAFDRLMTEFFGYASPDLPSPVDKSIFSFGSSVVNGVMIADNSCQTRSKQTQVQYRISSNDRVLEDAFHLIYETYVTSGLVEPNPIEMRILPHHLLPDTEVFVAEEKGRVLSTVTLISDGDLGLPMEEIYPHEVAALRRKGKWLGEVSCLASHDTTSVSHCLEVLRLMVQTARFRGLDCLAVAVHPKHMRFYKRFLAFEQLGEKISYPAVCHHPAVAMILDFDRIDREQPTNYWRFFGDPLPAETMSPQPMDDSQRSFFRYLMKLSNDLALPSLDQTLTGQGKGRSSSGNLEARENMRYEAYEPEVLSN